MNQNLLYKILIILIASSLNCKAQYSILRSFGCAYGSGYSPGGIDNGFVSDGTFLYGIAKFGGTAGNDLGVIIKMDMDSNNITYIHEFCYGDSIGYRPYGSLLLSNDTLYGVITNGGTYGMGAIFKLKTDGSGFNKIFDFKDTTTGIKPESPLVLHNNILYGKTWGGGWISGSCLYKINKDGSGFGQLRIFNTPFDPLTGNIVIKGNILYGMTENCIFKINITDTTYNELYYQTSFRPRGIIVTDSIIYVVSLNGGINGFGNIFSMNYDGSNYQTIFDFSNNVLGYHPSGNICLFDSTFYGFAYNGGKYGNGVIYEVNINGTKYKKLFDFYSSQDVTGKCPDGYLYYNDSSLYGLTYMRKNTCYGGNIFKYRLGRQIQTSNITFSNITSNSVNISWQKGNGTKRLVLIKKGTSPINIPIDYNDYPLYYYPYPIGSLDTNIIYCVYKDTGSFVTINNLVPDTIFSVHSFEFWYIKNGTLPIYCDYDTIYNPATFNTLTSTINNKISFDNDFIIFPNPVIDFLTIHNKANLINYSIEISNEIGQIIYKNKGCKSDQQINTKYFPKGVYIIKILINNNTFIEKVIKI